MFTVCPKCTLTLVVTTVDLRAGQGYVRCGRCANVFNALIALREGDPNNGTSDTANRRLAETAPTPPINPAVGAGVEMDLDPEPEPEPVPEPELEPELEAQPELDSPEYLVEEGSLEFDAASTDVADIFVTAPEAEQAGSGTFEAVVLGEESAIEEVADQPSHTDTIAADEWSLLDDEPVADDESVIEESPLIEQAAAPAPSGNQPDPPWVEEMFAEAEAEAERVRTSEHAVLAPEFEQESVEQPPEVVAEEAAATDDGAIVEAAPDEPALEPLLGGAAPQRPSWQMIAGVAALALLLVVQMLHFNRQNLVLSNALGPTVSKVYGWFGVTLTPRWDLTAYSVKQMGAEAEGGTGTQLRVRLSLKNESARVQPLPLLRLTLQDRFGNAVATRDLEPRDYLPTAAAGLRLLEPDQRIDAELQVVDPGRAAFGFEVDACLRAEGGAIGCSNDARRRTTG